jgi:hypothetical protein
MEDLLKLEYYLWQDKVEPALEMSKRGGHLWILLETPLLAKDCRIYIHDLATRLGVPVKGSGWETASKYFPDIMRLVTGSLAMQFAALWGFIGGQAAVIGSTGPITRWTHRWLTSTVYGS